MKRLPFSIHSDGLFYRKYPAYNSSLLLHNNLLTEEEKRILQIRKSFSSKRRGAKKVAQALKRRREITSAVLKKVPQIPNDLKPYITSFA